jgi:hypothetical protein
MAETSIDRIKRKYQPRVKMLLQGVIDAANHYGLAVGPIIGTSDEDYAWSFFVNDPKNEEKEAEVKVTLAESETWDGTTGGVNFMLDVDGRDEKIGGMIPYNYTDEVWVRRSKPEAIEARWRLFDEGVDPGAIVDSIQEHFQKRPRKRAGAHRRR